MNKYIMIKLFLLYSAASLALLRGLRQALLAKLKNGGGLLLLRCDALRAYVGGRIFTCCIGRRDALRALVGGMSSTFCRRYLIPNHPAKKFNMKKNMTKMPVSQFCCSHRTVLMGQKENRYAYDMRSIWEQKKTCMLSYPSSRAYTKVSTSLQRRSEYG